MTMKDEYAYIWDELWYLLNGSIIDLRDDNKGYGVSPGDTINREVVYRNSTGVVPSAFLR